MLKLAVKFPSRAELHQIVDRTTGEELAALSPLLGRAEILPLRATARAVVVAPHVRDYAVRLLEATHRDRPHAPELVKRYVRFGASPRGAQACLLAAKVRALFERNVHASIEDVRAVALP